ncbi:VanW family protein [Sporohalobacter salinus]|uniref:VanW family protein n=1 Tax=Sporohalobacter salinus TaxID=1494606 RepID=UPI0019614F34|nr:VanW family protein [Sporohalobacter salinus]MBM7624494.1 vancomycin resistance protein YoaR [Sporohalobacter salinus]
MRNKTLNSIILVIILLTIPIIIKSTNINDYNSKIIEPDNKIKSNNNQLTPNNFKITPNQNNLQLDLTQAPKKLLSNYKQSNIKKVNLLSLYTTPLKNDTPPRTNNIKVALKKLNNTIIKPKEKFSFNQQIGKLNSKNGYKPAPAIINNRLQPAYGGGVCQVSSTLYNALLKANLEIIERHPHSSSVNYVPSGKDATIVPNVKDLKFKNNKDFSILIQSNMFKKKVAIFLFKIYSK